MHHVCLLIQGKLDRFEASAHVRTVAEWLIFWHTAAAPKVVLSTENRIFNFVRSNSRCGRKRMLSILRLEPSFENLFAEFLNRNVWQTLKLLTKMSLQILVPLSHSLSTTFILSIEVIVCWTLQLTHASSQLRWCRLSIRWHWCFDLFDHWFGCLLCSGLLDVSFRLLLEVVENTETSCLATRNDGHSCSHKLLANIKHFNKLLVTAAFAQSSEQSWAYWAIMHRVRLTVAS